MKQPAIAPVLDSVQQLKHTRHDFPSSVAILPPALPQPSRGPPPDPAIRPSKPLPLNVAQRASSQPERPKRKSVFTLTDVAQARGGLSRPCDMRAEASCAPTAAHTVTSLSAASFEFQASGKGGAVGWQQMHDRLRQCAVAGATTPPDEGWTREQYRWIVWKLACLQRCFGGTRLPPSSAFSAAAVLRQLENRYAREYIHGARSIVRRLAEASEPSLAGAHMVLCIAAVDAEAHALELTDGWYSVWASLDGPLRLQLRRGRLRVGLKLRVWGCTITAAPRMPSAHAGANDTCATPASLPWESGGTASAPRLELHANGTRRASWDAVLGLDRRRLFRVGLDSLQPDGGRAPSVRVLVARVHGPLVFTRGEHGGIFQTLDEVVATDLAAQQAAHARQQDRQTKCQDLRDAREQRHERHSCRRGACEDAACPDGSGDDSDDSEAKRMPPRRSLVWRLMLVDADMRHQSSTSTPIVCASFCLWGVYGGEDALEQGPTEGQVGWILSANVQQANSNVSWPSSFGSNVRCLALEGQRGTAVWYTDQPPRRQSVGGMISTASAMPSTLASLRLAREHTPIACLTSATANTCFDTVGYLLYMTKPTAASTSVGDERESRCLFLADEACRLLCVRWVRSPNDALPRLRIGAPIAILNAKFEYTHQPAWSEATPLPDGLWHPSHGAYAAVVHHATVEPASFLAAQIFACGAGSSGAGITGGTGGAGSAGDYSLGGGKLTAHLRAVFSELSAQGDRRRDTLSKLAGLALDLVRGRIGNGLTSPQPSLQLQWQPPALLNKTVETNITEHSVPAQNRRLLQPMLSPGVHPTATRLQLLDSPATEPKEWSTLQAAIHGQLVEATARGTGLTADELSAWCADKPELAPAGGNTATELGTTVRQALNELLSDLSIYQVGNSFRSL